MKDFRDYIIKRETEITGVKPDATDLIKISDANHYFNSYQAKQCTTTVCIRCVAEHLNFRFKTNV